jgi:hypothetical protein
MDSDKDREPYIQTIQYPGWFLANFGAKSLFDLLSFRDAFLLNLGNPRLIGTGILSVRINPRGSRELITYPIFKTKLFKANESERWKQLPPSPLVSLPFPGVYVEFLQEGDTPTLFPEKEVFHLTKEMLDTTVYFLKGIPPL